VPFAAVAPMIVVSCAIGAYAIQNAMFDVWLMLLFGVVGYVFRRSASRWRRSRSLSCSGNRSEDSFRLSMIGSAGDFRVFWSNGLVGSITTLALLLLLWPLIAGPWPPYVARGRRRTLMWDAPSRGLTRHARVLHRTRERTINERGQ
jgi:TctA family transporter